MPKIFSLLPRRSEQQEEKTASLPPVEAILSDWADRLRARLEGVKNASPELDDAMREIETQTPFTGGAAASAALLSPVAMLGAATAYPAYRAAGRILNAPPGDSLRYGLRGAADGLGGGVGGVMGGTAGFMAGDAFAKSQSGGKDTSLASMPRLLGLLAGGYAGHAAGKGLARTVLPLSDRERREEQEKQSFDKQAFLPAVAGLNKLKGMAPAVGNWLGSAYGKADGALRPAMTAAKGTYSQHVAPYAGVAGRAAMGGLGGYLTGSALDPTDSGYGGLAGAVAGAVANPLHHRGLAQTGKLKQRIGNTQSSFARRFNDGTGRGENLAGRADLMGARGTQLEANKAVTAPASYVRDLGVRAMGGYGVGYGADQLTHATGMQNEDSNMFSRIGAGLGAGSKLLHGQFAKPTADRVGKFFNSAEDALPHDPKRSMMSYLSGDKELLKNKTDFGSAAGTARWLGTTMPGQVALGAGATGLAMAGNKINDKLDERARSAAAAATNQTASQFGITPGQMQQFGGMAQGVMNPIKSIAGGLMGQGGVPSFISQLSPAQQMAILGGLGVGAYGLASGNYGAGAAGAGIAAAPFAYNAMAGANPNYRQQGHMANPVHAGTY